jgi:hypothetical protein
LTIASAPFAGVSGHHPQIPNMTAKMTIKSKTKDPRRLSRDNHTANAKTM